MSVGERLRKNRACVKVVEAVTLFRDEPSLEKSTRLMECQLVVPPTLRETIIHERCLSSPWTSYQ